MNFRDYLKNNIVYLDGGFGTLLQAQGLKPGEYPERWNVSHPNVVESIHKAYFDAGSNVVCTNTFGANTLKFSLDELETIICAAVKNAKNAREHSEASQNKYIALDIGSTGKLLKPLGELDFEDAVKVFSQTVALGVKYGVDLVIIETMNDSYETKAALLAVKENCDLPVIVTNAYSEDGRLMTGATPAAMVALLEGMGVDALGANCSLGPAQLRGVAKELLENASVPVVLKPNAGLPCSVDGKTHFDVDAFEFSKEVAEAVTQGVRVVGGCCGTTPQYIAQVVKATKGLQPVEIQPKSITAVSSFSQAVCFGNKPILIGERINPTGKKRFKQALTENDIGYILAEGVNQKEKGVHILDVNVGLPDIDEKAMLLNVVCELQSVVDLPLQIDTADYGAMELALRRYNGKALINSVNGKQESMAHIFPLVKKYGGVVVALTLDEYGIPQTAEGRFNIAKKILAEAAKYGIDKKDIIFDTLAMTVSADNNSANITLEALSRIKNDLGCHTSLGVSNVSFGLPVRDAVNSTFFVLALQNGLSAAIMNPYSQDMMKAYYSYNALKGLDKNCAEYVNASSEFAVAAATAGAPSTANKDELKYSSELQYAIIKGFKAQAVELTMQSLEAKEPLTVVNEDIIPALNIVGEGFEKKTVYLPQLLISAEAAKAAFEVIKEHMPATNGENSSKTFIIATVYGDIHDIGKNIVKLLLENYGFNVVDLGKNVPAQEIADKAVELHAPIVGLSALMTTTVPAMEQTIKLLREQAPWCKVVVGGAVLTQEYADKIGADKYGADAMATVRYAEEIFNQ